MTTNIDISLKYSKENRKKFLEILGEFLSIPSISTSPENKKDILKAAEWVSNYLAKLGMKNVKIMPTKGHPIVYGELLNAGENSPTILVYGHYDVQPPDPIDLWHSRPFEPQIRNDKLYARGASDMKGQVMATLFALESILHAGPLPVNVKFLIEGEEEIGSPNLVGFLKENKKLFSSNVALNPDAGMIAENIPTIVYALRGLAYFELRVYGPDHDLHSGVFGGAIHNPAVALSKLLAGMHDQNGKIMLPGFYQNVKPLQENERKEIAKLPMDDAYYLDQTGAPAVWGEKGYTTAERVGARPTLDINGLFAGYTGKGSKTVIPSWAMAKISMRLVPDQDPEEVHQQLLDYLNKNAPKSVRWELMNLSGGPACATDPSIPASSALQNALESVWKVKPLFKREGGSIPIVADMQQILGIDTVLTGFGLPEDNIHSPNEHLNLRTWYKGIDALIHFFFNMKS